MSPGLLGGGFPNVTVGFCLRSEDWALGGFEGVSLGVWFRRWPYCSVYDLLCFVQHTCNTEWIKLREAPGRWLGAVLTFRFFGSMLPSRTESKRLINSSRCTSSRKSQRPKKGEKNTHRLNPAPSTHLQLENPSAPPKPKKKQRPACLRFTCPAILGRLGPFLGHSSSTPQALQASPESENAKSRASGALKPEAKKSPSPSPKP